MAKKNTPAIPPTGHSGPATVSAAALRLGHLLAKIRDELRQFLDAFQCAISGKGNVNWRGFCLEVPDPGNGGTISFPEETPHVTLSNFAIYRFNIPVSETDIDTAANYLRDCECGPDAQRLRDEFQHLHHAFCSLGDQVQLSDGTVANRKFFAQACATALWEHVNQLIGTVKAMSPPTAKTEPGEGNGGAAELPATHKAKRSTARGEAQAKIIAALTAHHQYTNGGCSNLAPIGVRELARMASTRQAKVSAGSASAFFKKQFQGHDKYKARCNNPSELVLSLKLLNGEISPCSLFGRDPPGEGGTRDEE